MSRIDLLDDVEEVLALIPSNETVHQKLREWKDQVDCDETKTEEQLCNEMCKIVTHNIPSLGREILSGWKFRVCHLALWGKSGIP